MRRIALIGLLCFPAVSRGQTLRGQVVDKASRTPLGYSSITLVGRAEERLAGESGRFEFTNLKTGNVVLHVRHVGYVPADVPVTITAGDPVQVVVELTHVPVMLPAMHVDEGICRSPGPPPRADSLLAVAFQQLELNAQQFHLVTTKYPFVTRVERRFSRSIELAHKGAAGDTAVKVDTTDSQTRRDTITLRSDREQRYEPGNVVVNNGPLGRALAIPTLAVFADERFQKTHCFWSPGVIDVDGQRLLRVDFRAAESIGDPDLDGSLYLDPETFGIKQSIVSLTKMADVSTVYDSVIVDTRFSDIVPGVPIIASTKGRDVLSAKERRDQRKVVNGQDLRALSDNEVQIVQGYAFIASRPPSDTAASKRPAIPHP